MTDRIARLRDLHRPRTYRRNACCVQCGIVWPCPTRLVLDEEPAAAPSAPAGRDLRHRIALAVRETVTRVMDLRGFDTQIADAVLAVLPASADRTAVLREAADVCDEAGSAYTAQALNDQAGAAFSLMETFRRKAAEAEYVATPCDPGGCEPGGEPCHTHERLMAHGDGDHELCGPDCGTSAARFPGMADEAQQAESKAAPAVAYSGKGRVFCVTCPHPADENVPLTPADVQPYECCAACDRELIQVAYEAQRAGEGEPETLDPEVVAFRDPNHPELLLCRQHGIRHVGMVPLTSNDLPDGGICTFGRLSSYECGVDVLILQAGEGR